jgi:hypothetical protein
MGYFCTLTGYIDNDSVKLDDEKFKELKENRLWITFDEYGFKYAGNWCDGLVLFLNELSRIIRKGKIIIDYGGDESMDIKQFKIAKNCVKARILKKIIYDKWHEFEEDY